MQLPNLKLQSAKLLNSLKGQHDLHMLKRFSAPCVTFAFAGVISITLKHIPLRFSSQNLVCTPL